MPSLANVYAAFKALRQGERTVVLLGESTIVCAALTALSGLGARRAAVVADEDVLRDAWAAMDAVKMPSVLEHATVYPVNKLSYKAFNGVNLVVALAHPTHGLASLAAYQVKELSKCQLGVVWPYASSEADAVDWTARVLQREGVVAVGTPCHQGELLPRGEETGALEDAEYYPGEKRFRVVAPDGRALEVVASCATWKTEPQASLARDKRDFYLAHSNQMDATYAGKPPCVVCACDDVLQYLRKSRHWRGAHQLVSTRSACAELARLELQHKTMDVPFAPSAHAFALVCRSALKAGATTVRRTTWFAPGVDQSSHAGRV